MTPQKIYQTAISGVFALLLLSGCADDDENFSSFASTSLDADVIVDNGPRGETVNVGLISWRNLPFQTVKHQAYDYSCGSAAVATLMSYTYKKLVSEENVFREMFAKGDQGKIRREGFSMLDMSNYLNAHGLKAKGYRLNEEKIAKYRVPFIALINNKGYNHFVVVKSMGDGRILVGDPNSGNTQYDLDSFAQVWNGLALVVTNDASQGRMAYDDPKEWRFAHARALRRTGNDVSAETADLPVAWQIFPTGGDLLASTTIGTVASVASGGR